MAAKFKEGEIVFERIRPTNKLIIVRRDNGLYYCRPSSGLRRKDLVYMERDLVAEKEENTATAIKIHP
ncbi:MAG TPA: hypothetical protein VIU12_14890 [Chryseolinea sp.]